MVTAHAVDLPEAGDLCVEFPRRLLPARIACAHPEGTATGLLNPRNQGSPLGEDLRELQGITCVGAPRTAEHRKFIRLRQFLHSGDSILVKQRRMHQLDAIDPSVLEFTENIFENRIRVIPGLLRGEHPAMRTHGYSAGGGESADRQGSEKRSSPHEFVVIPFNGNSVGASGSVYIRTTSRAASSNLPRSPAGSTTSIRRPKLRANWIASSSASKRIRVRVRSPTAPPSAGDSSGAAAGLRAAGQPAYKKYARKRDKGCQEIHRSRFVSPPQPHPGPSPGNDRIPRIQTLWYSLCMRGAAEMPQLCRCSVAGFRTTDRPGNSAPAASCVIARLRAQHCTRLPHVPPSLLVYAAARSGTRFNPREWRRSSFTCYSGHRTLKLCQRLLMSRN